MAHHIIFNSYLRFSSEICGTIIVQCVPILRPFIKEITPTFQSSFAKRSRQSTLIKSQRSRHSFRNSIPLKVLEQSEADLEGGSYFSHKRHPRIKLSQDIIRHTPEDPNRFGPSPAKGEIHVRIVRDIYSSPAGAAPQQAPRRSVVWPFGGEDRASPIGDVSPDLLWLEADEEYRGRGLSAPPPPGRDLKDNRARRK